MRKKSKTFLNITHIKKFNISHMFNSDRMLTLNA